MCVNAIHAGSTDADPAKWRVTQERMEREIRKVRETKAEHSRQRKGRSGEIAFEGAGLSWAWMWMGQGVEGV
jgi:hypothetical protein